MVTQVVLVIVMLTALAVRTCLGFGFSLVLVPLAAIAIGLDQAVLLAIALEVASGIMMAIEHRARLRLVDAVLMKASSYGGLVTGIALRGTGSLSVLVFVRWDSSPVHAPCSLYSREECTSPASSAWDARAS